MNRLFGKVRYLAVFAVLGLTITMTVTFAWAVAKTVRLIGSFFDGGWRSDLPVVELLEAIDSYLLAIVQLIVVLGLYELFVHQLDLPDWLEARSLEDLKKSIVDVLIVFIGIKGIERLVAVQEPIDALTYTAAVALLIAALSLFRLKPRRSPIGAGTAKTQASGAASGPNTSAT